MNVTIENVGAVRKRVNVVIPAEKVDQEIERSFSQIQKHAVIKGFRKGKAPRSHVEKHYASVMREEVVKNLFQNTYPEVIREHNIAAISFPVVDFGSLDRGSDFSYSAMVEVYPEVTATGYRGLEVKRERMLFDEGMVDAQIQQMRESMAELVPVDPPRPVERGDFVRFDFDGFVDGEPLAGGSAKDFELEIGSSRFIPGFEEQMIGFPIGEEREITVTFPEEYHAPHLAGKEARFQITIKEIKVKRLPELDDAFAAEFGEYSTLEELKGAIRENIEKQQRDRIESDFRDRLIEALIAKNPIEVPSSMVDRQVENMLQNAKRRLAAQRMTLEMMGMDDDRYRATFRHVAEAQVKGGILLESVAEQEGITVSDEFFDQKLQELSGGNGEALGRMREFYQQNAEARANYLSHLREELALNLLAEHAVVTEVSADELKKESDGE